VAAIAGQRCVKAEERHGGNAVPVDCVKSDEGRQHEGGQKAGLELLQESRAEVRGC
jgi:hypothetical protein